MAKKKVLVCGSEGSLMKAVIPKLMERYEVIGVDNFQKYEEVEMGKPLRPYTIECLDLTMENEVFDLFREYEPEFVIQGAAQVYGVGGFNKYPADILANDVDLHSNVLKASVKYGIKRVVFISSSMVYENVPDEFRDGSYEWSVSQYPAPYTDYGLSKFVNERLCKAYQKQYGLDYTIWRPFNIITPYEKASEQIGTSHVFADFIENIVDKRLNPLPIIGDGEQVRCFTWIDEVAQAITDFSFDDRTKNEIFNLGRNEPVTMIELAKTIYDVALEIYTSPYAFPLEFETVREYKNDVKYRVPNVEKARDILHWSAKKPLRESIKECIMYHYRSKKW